MRGGTARTKKLRTSIQISSEKVSERISTITCIRAEQIDVEITRKEVVALGEIHYARSNWNNAVVLLQRVSSHEVHLLVDSGAETLLGGVAENNFVTDNPHQKSRMSSNFVDNISVGNKCISTIWELWDGDAVIRT
jgi:hypothetical protein